MPYHHDITADLVREAVERERSDQTAVRAELAALREQVARLVDRVCVLEDHQRARIERERQAAEAGAGR